MKVLHERNPLVALVKQETPNLSNGQARIAAMEIRDQYSTGITELGTLAENVLEIFGDGTDITSVRNAASGFMGGLAVGGISSLANIFIASLPLLHERIRTVMDPEKDLDPDELRKLFHDCAAMKTGGPAAE